MKRCTFILIFFGIFGIIYSYPLILHLNNSIPYTYIPPKGFQEAQFIQGDHLQLYYTLWLFKDFFKQGCKGFFNDPYIFCVKDIPRPYTTRGLPMSIPYTIFSLFGDIPAYNLLVILSFILCGTTMFLLAKKYLIYPFASLISATVFTLMPFRLIHLFGGHPCGFTVFWLPLVILFYELLWEEGKWLFAWLSGISLFLMAIEEPHFIYYTLLFTLVFWGYKFILYKNLKKTLTLSIPILISWTIVISYMVFIKYIVIGHSIAGTGRNLQEIALFSPTIKDILRRSNPISEKNIYIGIIPSIIAIFSLFEKRNRGNILFFICVTVFTLSLSLGPNLTHPPIYKICYKLIPFFKYPRSPSRIIVFTSLSLSILTGYGIKNLMLVKRKYLRYFFNLIILALICIDFKLTSKIGISYLPKGNMVYQYVKKLNPHSPILEIPIWPGDTSWSSMYQYYTTIYRIPIINGYSAFVRKEYVDKIFWKLVAINMGILGEEEYNLLSQLGVKHIILHNDAYPSKVSPFPFKIALKNLNKNPYVRFIMKHGPLYLYSLVDIQPQKYKPTTAPSKTGLFYECEQLSHRYGILLEDKDASIGSSLFIERSIEKPIEFVFGPWKLFPSGRYKVLYRLKGISSCTIEVTTDFGKTKIAYKNLDINQDKYGDYILNFKLKKTQRLEFRIIYKTGKLWADYIYILCAEEVDPQWHFEAEDLYHIGEEAMDNDANNRYAIYVTPQDYPIDIVYGPYRRYPAGSYRIGFRIKSIGATHIPICTIQVTSANSNQVINERILYGYECHNSYNYFYLPIKLDKPLALEFKVKFLRNAPVYVDCIIIEPN